MIRLVKQLVMLGILCLIGISPFLVPAPATAQDFTPHGLGTIPILYEGRVKPLGSLARYMRKNLYGNEQDAEQFLAESLFNPAYAENLPFIKVSNPEILSLLSLPTKKEKRYNFRQLSGALRAQKDLIISLAQQPQKNWTPAQKALMELQEKTFAYGDLLSSMTLYLPLTMHLPSKGLPAELQPMADRDITFTEAKPFESFLRRYLEEILERNGENVEKYTEAEQAVAYLSFNLMNLSNSGQKSTLFTVIPYESKSKTKTDTSHNEKIEWITPWHYIFTSAHIKRIEDERESHKLSKISNLWQELAHAYHKGEQSLWNRKIIELQESYAEITPHYNLVILEHYYNRIDPFYVSCLFYSAALLCLLLASMALAPRFFMFTAIITFISGLIIHGGGIAARIMILGRPPVSTLYESIVFVGFICVFYALVMYMMRRQKLWLIMGALLGVIIHILGFAHNQDSDSFLMLPAVLNTNFWLATHVICITIGYALCLMTSILAHFYLTIFAIEKRMENISKWRTLLPPVTLTHMPGLHHLALLSLLFASVGTVLGGIWADQSWGRFWGWDPKENGALLIVLWLVWVLHGRLSGCLSPLSYVAGLAYLSVIVALSWFGVNLLSVGLHAYGFTDSAAYMLGSITVMETIAIAALYIMAYLRFKNNNAIKV